MSKAYKTEAAGIERKDVYTRVTERIISDLEQGIRTWMKPWHVEHTAGNLFTKLFQRDMFARRYDLMDLPSEVFADTRQFGQILFGTDHFVQ